MAGVTLYEAISDYLDALRLEGVPDGTYRQYRSVLYRLHRQLPRRKYSSVQERDLFVFLYGPRGISNGKARGTASVQRAALNSFFRYTRAIQGGSYVQAPRQVISKRVPKPRARPTRLTEHALAQLLTSCEDTPRGIVLRGMLAVGINTAWRMSDILKIRIGDADLITGELHFVSKKTGKSDSFPITLDLDEELRSYLRWYSRTVGVSIADTEAFLFPGWVLGGSVKGVVTPPRPTPLRPPSSTWSQEALKRLFAKCGIHVERGECWHVIRRSVARIYFDNLRHEISHDHALRQTAALLQHDSVTTTEGYLGLSTEIAARNESLRGKRFIGAAPSSVVVPMRRGG